MIGTRCLGPGGSAIRSSAVRAPDAAAAASLTAPLAECSYRTWQPPSLHASEDTRRWVRPFSSASHSKRSHVTSPHVAVSVDQHGIESILHDPPFADAKVKRLRPIGGPIPDIQSSGVHAPLPDQHETTSDTRSGFFTSTNYIGSTQITPGSSSLNKNAALVSRSDAIPTPSRFHSDIPTAVLLDYLTTSDKATFQHIKAQLPPSFHRVDAYLLLRERDPQSLSVLSYYDIFSLIRRAGRDGLGSVMSLLLRDIIGPDTSNAKAKPGRFQIFAGTEERYKLLREILVRCTHADFLMHDGSALDLFMLMLGDQIQLRQSATIASNASEVRPDTPAGPDAALSVAEGVTPSIPDNFPVGEARRLIKLAVHLHQPELVSIVNSLRAHLEAHTPDFPTAREGEQLIDYYLQPDLREFGAALEVVRGLRDTNALAQEVVDDSIRDGKAYLAQLEATFSLQTDAPQDQPSDEELQQICMDVSLRLIAMKSLMVQRPKGGVQFRKAFESLVASFRLDLIESHQLRPGQPAASSLDVPFRSIRSVFLHQVGQNDKPCLNEALYILQRCDQRLVAMLPLRDLQEYCDAARSQGIPRSAAELYARFVKVKTSSAATSGLPIDCKHVLTRDGFMVNSHFFLNHMRELLTRGQKIAINALLRALRVLPLTDLAVSQLNVRFSNPQRSRFIGLLADIGSTEEAFELYQHWSHWRYDPEWDSSQSLNLRRAGSVQVADPSVERQVRLMHDTDRQVAISASCLIPLVRALCRQPSANRPNASQASPKTTASDHLKKARFVLDVFRQSCTPMDWTHYRLTALARACFIAKDVPGAFDALAKISFLREIPDQVDIAVLLGGLMEHDPDRAVDLFIQHCSIPVAVASKGPAATKGAKSGSVASAQKVEDGPKLAPMKATSGLTSTLISRAFAQNRMDLVDRLHQFSQAVGISSRLGHVASLRALFTPDISPAEATQTIHRMLQNGWMTDPVLLEKLAQMLLSKSVQPIGVVEKDQGAMEKSAKQGRKALSPEHRLRLVQTAVRLMQISARFKDVVNLRTVNRALGAITRNSTSFARPLAGKVNADTDAKPSTSNQAARHRNQATRRRLWIKILDSIVYQLRWTKFFDTGDDYQRSLPLWRSSLDSNGELVSAELDEMMEHGFRGNQPQRASKQVSAALATLPTSTESLHQSGEVTNDSRQDMLIDSPAQRNHAESPNALPADLFCRLIESYLALGDSLGAAEVAAWMRDEAKIDIAPTSQENSDFVHRIKSAVLRGEAQTSANSGSEEASVKRLPDSISPQSSNVLRMLAGQQSTARTKSWWTPRR